MTELITRPVATTVEELIVQWEGKQELKLLFVNFPEFTKVAARPILIANDLVSVQPMAAPQGIFNYIEYVYEGTPEIRDCGIEKTLNENL